MLSNDDVLISLPRCGLLVVSLFVGGIVLGALADVHHVESELLVAYATSLMMIAHVGLPKFLTSFLVIKCVVVRFLDLVFLKIKCVFALNAKENSVTQLQRPA